MPFKALTNLIKNTCGNLIEICIDCTCFQRFGIDINNEGLIQAIYQNCPNLKYLRMSIKNVNVLEFEQLLINCQYLDGLYLDITMGDFASNWDNLFEILTRSSPTGLFKFKFEFSSGSTPIPESLKFLFDNWKGRCPMLLQFNELHYGCVVVTYSSPDEIPSTKIFNLVKKYENLVNFKYTWYEERFEDSFKWEILRN
jgi:hypothetical protein